MKDETVLIIGSRTSNLAMWQTRHIISRLEAAWPDLRCEVEPFVTRGDKTLDKPLPEIGGKGLFTAELERALLDGEIDLAVHSLKDLPIEDGPGLTLGAITSRANVADGLVARNGWTLDTLPQGAIVGTSSNRRQAQLRAARPDLVVKSIRGNVETRVRKVFDGQFDATVLAAAGLQRLGLTDVVTQWLPLDIMLPAPGQGALAVQCRADDPATLALLAAIEDEAVRTAVTAERTFLGALGGGCSAPIAAYAKQIPDNKLQMTALVGDLNGRQLIHVQGEDSDPYTLGENLAQQARAQGAAVLLGHTPLRGKRIVVTRSVEQSESFAAHLSQLGAEVIVQPAIQFVPLPTVELQRAVGKLDLYDWLLLTSGNAVDFFFQGLNGQTNLLTLPPVAAIGQATARKLADRDITPTFVPEAYIGEKLVEGLGNLSGKRVLLPRAKIGRPQIVELLRDKGALVDEVALYDTVTAVADPVAMQEIAQGVDAITFTSPSSVRNFLKILRDAEQVMPETAVACIGPITAAEARKQGLTVQVMPQEYTTTALADALGQFFQGS